MPDLVVQVSSLLLGMVVGVLITACFCFPRVARAVGKILAVTLMGAGAGLITWGLVTSLGQEDFKPLTIGPITFFFVSQILGCGAGCIVAGITSLVLALVGRSNNPVGR